jgi:hypothetical protein
MVREAQKAGLEFDDEKLEALHCCHEDRTFGEQRRQTIVPAIAVDPASPALDDSQINGSDATKAPANGCVDDDHIFTHHHTHPDTDFHRKLHYAATQGRMHDVLQLNNGAGRMGVFSWNIMEYMPFRRMDLCEDGSWKAIRWPLPKGETRDIPDDAIIHASVIKRMVADPTYRGVRTAPEEMGIGKWVCYGEEGHPVGECFVRKEKPVKKVMEQSSHSNVMPSGPQGNYFSGR